MFDLKKTNSLWRRGIASVVLCLVATAEAAAEPSPLPELEPVAVEVDITSLPVSERAALVPLLRAARQMDTLYVRQVWPGTRALVKERQSTINRATADADTARAAMEFISLMAIGDAAAVKSLLQHYAVVTPTIRNVLAPLGPPPPLQLPIYRTADRLSPTDR
jgi:hypothetical protein